MTKIEMEDQFMTKRCTCRVEKTPQYKCKRRHNTNARDTNTRQLHLFDTLLSGVSSLDLPPYKCPRYKDRIAIPHRNARYVCVKMEGMHV